MQYEEKTFSTNCILNQFRPMLIYKDKNIQHKNETYRMLGIDVRMEKMIY